LEVFIAGALVGTLMGLATQAYWLIAFSYRAPRLAADQKSRIGTVVIFGGLLAVGGWMLVGGFLGLLIAAIAPDELDATLVPSVAYLFVLAFLATFALIPLLALLRTWKKHILLTYIAFVGLFGLVLPNLVIAIQN
jgi:hypothetical protein